MRKSCFKLVTVLAISCVRWTSLADTTNLTPNADTCLFQAFPDNNLGKWTDFPAGTTRDNQRARGLIRFDLTQIPSSATITSASIRLEAMKKPTSATPSGSMFGFHRVLRDWGEGEKGAANMIGEVAGQGEASWNNRFAPDQPWGTPGGQADADYVGAFSATNFVDDLGTYTFTSMQLAADVQRWVSNPSTNFGWIFITQSEGTPYTARRFASREDTTSPPVLIINYTVASLATSPTITPPALVGNKIRFSFNAEANRTYAVEHRGVVDSGTWLVLTNVPAQGSAGAIQVEDTVSGGAQFYRVRTP
jgi:hypothetical protein